MSGMSEGQREKFAAAAEQVIKDFPQSDPRLFAHVTSTPMPATQAATEEWIIIEALNRVSLIDIMLDAAREAKFGERVSGHMLQTFAMAIRAHFAKKATATLTTATDLRKEALKSLESAYMAGYFAGSVESSPTDPDALERAICSWESSPKAYGILTSLKHLSVAAGPGAEGDRNKPQQ